MKELVGLTTEGISWCQSLNEQSLSWPAVRELLKARYPAILERFVGLEKIDSSALSDIRLARKAGGFAFEYWCTGGDITDIDRLLEHFNSMLGNLYNTEDKAESSLKTKQRVMDKIVQNAELDFQYQTLTVDDVWNLNANERKSLLCKWKEEINPQAILDKTAEIHRRHQAALLRKAKAYRALDARCLGQRLLLFPVCTAQRTNNATRRCNCNNYHGLCNVLGYLK